MAIFSVAEITHRQRVFADYLREAGVDGCLLTSADNVYYLTGVPLLSEWGRPMWLVFPAEGVPTIVAAEVETETVQRFARGCELRTYGDDSRLDHVLPRLVAEHIGATDVLGIERSAISLDACDALTARIGPTKTVDIAPQLSAMRLVKSPEELRLLEVAAEVAKIGANAFLEALTPAATELAVAGRAVFEMNRAVAALLPEGATSSYAYCHFGTDTLSPHLHPTGRRLAPGDLIGLNVFPVVWGYCVELERTLCYGDPSDTVARRLPILWEAFNAGKQAFRPGRSFAEVNAITTQVLAHHGLDRFIRHGTGHAHGIMVGSMGREELGEIRTYNDNVIAPGMVNSIEPGFYIPGEGGFRHSDVLIATADGARCITEWATPQYI